MKEKIRLKYRFYIHKNFEFNFKIDFGEFIFDLLDFLSGPSQIDKEMKKKGKLSKLGLEVYYDQRVFQIISIIFIPITILIALIENINIKWFWYN